jgi:hypothetical protein
LHLVLHRHQLQAEDLEHPREQTQRHLRTQLLRQPPETPPQQLRQQNPPRQATRNLLLAMRLHPVNPMRSRRMSWMHCHPTSVRKSLQAKAAHKRHQFKLQLTQLKLKTWITHLSLQH